VAPKKIDGVDAMLGSCLCDEAQRMALGYTGRTGAETADLVTGNDGGRAFPGDQD